MSLCVTIWGASAHSLGTGSKATSRWFWQGNGSRFWPMKCGRTLGRFVGKVHLAQERGSGGRHLLCAGVAVTPGRPGIAAASGTRGGNHSKENTEGGRVGRWRDSGLNDIVWLPNPGRAHLWTSSCVSWHLPGEFNLFRTGLPVPWQPNPSCYPGKRRLENTVLALLHLGSPIKVAEKSHNPLLTFVQCRACQIYLTEETFFP